LNGGYAKGVYKNVEGFWRTLDKWRKNYCQGSEVKLEAKEPKGFIL